VEAPAGQDVVGRICTAGAIHLRPLPEKAITLLGGAGSSLLFGIVFAGIALTSSTPVVFAFFGKLSLLALLGLLELIPAHRNGIGSDGYRLWQMIRVGNLSIPWCERFWRRPATLLLCAIVTGHTR